MSDSTCPKNAFVVITSGAEAKFFVNEGNPLNIKLRYAGGLNPKDLDDDGPSGSRPPVIVMPSRLAVALWIDRQRLVPCP